MATIMGMNNWHCLWACKQFVPWGSSGPVLLAINNWLDTTKPVEKDEEVESVTLPPGIYPLLLWLSEESEDESSSMTIAVDPLLVRFCGRHQREGVQFILDCILESYGAANINGCILADDVGKHFIASVSIL
ncbi:hypothetical protein SLE2022_204040 [Rubroshorea leprosula]